MRRSIFLLCLLLCSSSLWAEPPKNYPFVSFDVGLAQARKQHKDMFVYFGRFGCGYCEKVNRETFVNKMLRKAYIKHYVLVYVDAESGERLTLADGRFVVLWEAGDHIWSRLVSAKQRGPVQQLSTGVARQATVTSVNGQLWLGWAAKAGTHYQIVTTSAKIVGDQLQLADIKPADPNPPKQDQMYPSIAIAHDGVVVAWEDRRYGHTRIFAAHAASGQGFSALQQINQLKPAQSEKYGKGTGAKRVVLASDGQHKLIASWLDKRNFVEGYDVYAAFSQDGGKSFGVNEKVEDMLGANQAQWHTVSAMDSHGDAVVAWDDQRDGSPDVWLSEYKAGGWSDDDSPDAAHTTGSQTHPAIDFDRQGLLHLLFLSREHGKSTIRYLLATPDKADSGQ